MQAREGGWQEDLFVTASLTSLIPEGHILRRVDAILNLLRLHEQVRSAIAKATGVRAPTWSQHGG